MSLWKRNTKSAKYFYIFILTNICLAGFNRNLERSGLDLTNKRGSGRGVLIPHSRTYFMKIPLPVIFKIAFPNPVFFFQENIFSADDRSELATFDAILNTLNAELELYRYDLTASPVNP